MLTFGLISSIAVSAVPAPVHSALAVGGICLGSNDQPMGTSLKHLLSLRPSVNPESVADMAIIVAIPTGLDSEQFVGWTSCRRVTC